MVRGGCVPILVMVRQKSVISASDWKSMLPDMSRVPEALKEDFMAVLEKHSAIFANELPPGLPPNVLPCRAIPLEHGVRPIYRQRHRLSPLENEVIEKEVKSLLDKGLIQPSISPFGAPILFLPKPDGTLRCVLDYRELNAVTIKNRHPIPRIDDIIDQFRGASVFSNLDLVSAYNQFQLQLKDQQASAFSTPQGHFEWKVLSLGLTNAPGVFSRAMYDILSPLMNGPNRCIVAYLDDIAILSKTPEEHVKYVEMTLKLLHDAKLLVKLRKCHFFQPEIKFLGHILSAQGVQADPQNLEDNPADGLSRLHGTLVKSASIVVLPALSPSLMDHVVAAYSADSRFTDE
ncbi:hypothetical protein CEUSTIGMA_g11170.t1 [Chlamydomonas eustigma]|uniref:Reverse transcriptase domain-containing protein n=1 Tax=Chlamydomonas eustigma TaxID=1157962 RepID=A0A250XKX0_9CHLO|nr:hypothetical protein CEUSTIGMA_g11170.t1 [Chlamydomonas eustigma]|eukprot:GAX83745.1 hypothetical protein CEUSTIGMA_g11170.t1 [Chlamydomonas eustigma]